MDAAIKLGMKRLDDSLEIINQLQIFIEEKDRHIESQNHQIRLLEEKINHLLHRHFESMSERFVDRKQSLFEDENVTCEVETVTEIEVLANIRRIGGRRNLPENLPHEAIHLWSLSHLDRRRDLFSV